MDVRALRIWAGWFDGTERVKREGGVEWRVNGIGWESGTGRKQREG